MSDHENRFMGPRGRPRETNYITFDPHLCTACWICIRVCPGRVFGKVDLPLHKHARLERVDDCNGCEGLPHVRCVRVCKSSALRLRQPPAGALGGVYSNNDSPSVDSHTAMV